MRAVLNPATMPLPAVRLPRTTRVGWVSDAANAAWAGRLVRAAAAWRRIEGLSVLASVRLCGISKMRGEEANAFLQELHRRGMVARRIEGPSWPSFDQVPVAETVLMAFGRRDALLDLEACWRSEDHDGLGTLLGYPACCRRAFDAWSVRGGWTDPNCANAAASVNAAEPGSLRAETNTIWWRLGIRGIPHFACTPTCTPSTHLARLMFQLGASDGLVQEVGWISDVLNWPVRWSALHGIAEITSPVMRVVVDTDATNGRATLQFQGSSVPQEAAKGTTFPFTARRQHERSSQSVVLRKRVEVGR